MKSILLSLFILLVIVGCGEKTTGDKVDNAVDSTKEAASNALDSLKKVVD